MIYGSHRIYPIFGPTGPKIGKASQFYFFFFLIIIKLAATSFLKRKLFEQRKDTFYLKVH